MAKYIHKQAAIHALVNEANIHNNPLKRAYARAAAIIEQITAEDVQPVKRGEWCPPLMGQGKCSTYCSRCFGTVTRNTTGIFEETPFCPHCGADMRSPEAIKG